MGNVFFPQFANRLGIRESDDALLLGSSVALVPSSAGLAFSGSFSTAANWLTSGSVGTVTTAATTTAVEHGDAIDHLTVLTLTAFAIGTSDDNASLAIGAKFYTFPAGTILVDGATIVGGVTAAISVTTNTPEVGIGTVIGSTASATLSSTMEDIVDGGAAGVIGGDTVAPDVAGTAFYKGSLSTGAGAPPVMIKTTGGKSRDLFLNVAAAWANVAAAGAVTFTGVITLKWRIVS